MRQGARVFIRFFVSYLLIMLIPFCVAIRMSSEEVSRARQDVYAKDTLLLEQGQRTMQNILSSMNDMIQSLSSNISVNQLMTYDNVYEDRSTLTNFIDVRNALHEFNLFGYADAFFLYAYRSDTLINGSQIIYDASAGNLRFLLPGDTSETDVRRISGLLLTTRYRYEFLSPVTMRPPGNRMLFDEYIPYAFTITNSAGRDAVNVVILMQVDTLRSLLGFVSNTGWLYSSVSTLDGLTLFETGDGFEYDGELDGASGCVTGNVDGRSALISYVTDYANGLRYISVSGMSQIEELVADTIRSLVITLLATGALGMLLAGLLALRTTAPLRRMLLGINSHPRADDAPAVEYQNLDKELMRIMSENQTLKDEMNLQAPLLRGALAARWLYGEYASIDELFEAYSRAGCELGYRLYAVVIAEIPARRIHDAGNADRALVKALLRENLPELIDIADTGISALTLIAGSALRDKDQWKRTLHDRLEQTRTVLLAKAGLELSCCAALAGDANRVHVAYVELRRLAEGDAGHDAGIRWLAQDASGGSDAYFPVELEMHIIDAIKNGDDTELSSAFARLYTENAVRRELSGGELRRLAAVINALFIRLGYDGFDADIAEAHSGQATTEALLNRAQKLLLERCGQSRAEHLSKQQELRLAIEKYICQNFADPQLSLSSAADALGYTQAYISRVFKQQTGELFSAYVERMRLEHARELLRRGELPVYRIAAECGYNSVQVFRRAFARSYGESPSSYAEKAGHDVAK